MTPPSPLPQASAARSQAQIPNHRATASRYLALALTLASIGTALPLLGQNTPAAQPKQQRQSADAPAEENGTTTPQDPKPAAPPVADQPVPAAPPASTASGAPGIDNEKYVIGPEDNLQITVWREPTLSGVLPVRPDGMISLALLGDVKAAGFTPMQLSNDIATRLRKYIQDPSVTVAVTAVNSQRVFLVGEVGHVGPIPLTPGMTPLQALSTAGGPTPYANIKHIYLLRGTGATQQKIPYNYKKALKGEAQPGVTLQPGDTIVVP